MASRTTKALSLTAALAGGIIGGLDNAVEKAFNDFVGSDKAKVERTGHSDYINLAYAGEPNSIDGKVDTTTYWAPDKLREVINDKKSTFIYWRIEGGTYTSKGDRFFKDVLRDYGSEFDRIIVIEGLKHGQTVYGALNDVLDEVNPQERAYSHRNPIFSMVGFGAEGRLRGPPPEPYEKKYNEVRQIIEHNILWFNSKKREAFLDTK